MDGARYVDGLTCAIGCGIVCGIVAKFPDGIVGTPAWAVDGHAGCLSCGREKDVMEYKARMNKNELFEEVMMFD